MDWSGPCSREEDEEVFVSEVRVKMKKKNENDSYYILDITCVGLK